MAKEDNQNLIDLTILNKSLLVSSHFSQQPEVITYSNGKVLKNSFDLEVLLKNTNWKNLKK